MALADYIKSRLPHWPNWITLPLLKLNCFGGMCYGKMYLHYGTKVEATTSDEKLIDIVNYAIGHVPYYRKRYEGITIKSKKEFEEKIGFIDKDEVLSHWNDFVADDADLSKCYIESTGGTSGKPMRFLSSKTRYIHSMYFWHKQMKAFGWHYDTVGVIRNHRLKPGRIYMVNPIMKQVIFDGFDTTGAYFSQVWRVLKTNKIKYLYCYPSSAYSFLKYCSRSGLDTSFIKACFLTSEEVTEFQRQFIQDNLNIEILASYGHSEKLCLAGTIPSEFSYFIDDQYGLTELVDEKGNVIKDADIEGEIVGTTYVNHFFPLIRYRTGDYSAYAASAHEKCDLHCLGRIHGRRDKSLIIKHDGSSTTLATLNLHSDFNDKIDGLQYLQKKKGYLTALVIKNDGYSEAEHRFLLDHLANAMGGIEYVNIKYVDSLVFQENGKFLPLITKF